MLPTNSPLVMTCVVRSEVWGGRPAHRADGVRHETGSGGDATCWKKSGQEGGDGHTWLFSAVFIMLNSQYISAKFYRLLRVGTSDICPSLLLCVTDKALTSKEKKVQEQDRSRITSHFIPLLPQLLAKVRRHCSPVQLHWETTHTHSCGSSSSARRRLEAEGRRSFIFNSCFCLPVMTPAVLGRWKERKIPSQSSTLLWPGDVQQSSMDGQGNRVTKLGVIPFRNIHI